MDENERALSSQMPVSKHTRNKPAPYFQMILPAWEGNIAEGEIECRWRLRHWQWRYRNYPHRNIHRYADIYQAEQKGNEK
ncbi:hypothetical protein KDA_02830 [Dictyobacter alpinus]|uniref:Uncharacterized protein n=1 Tax=Dictyobacter alpinus TaxID=2014873 RepID=A0A402B0C5_9CHLR|nr:hypothetical protein KDA_02830 [Dictyobacter alpinus]